VKGTPPSWHIFKTTPISLGSAALSPLGTFSFDPQFQAPTSSSSKLAQTFPITVAAVATP